jgi:N-methylhydantoinase B
MVSKMRGIALARGERVRLETPGGGGWGHGAERNPAQREADAAMGYVSTDSKKKASE